MSGPNPTKIGAVLLVVIVVASFSVPLKGGLYLSNFEGDALHLADIVYRMNAGQTPHLHFMTPLGGLAFVPVSLFSSFGIRLDLAYTFGQALVALLMLPAIAHTAASRLPRITSWGFSIFCALYLTSLAHGDDGTITAISMHYNRWAWVMAFVATVLVVLPPRGKATPVIDGITVAVLLWLLAFLKITYFVTFLPALVLILLLRRDWQMLTVGLVAAAALAVVTILGAGVTYVMAYYGDLRTVAAAPLRGAPGLDLADIAISPAYLAGTLTLLGAVFALRKKGRGVEGLSILILLPVFLVVTWQNHGNDPVWLILLAVICGTLWNANRRMVGVGMAGLAALVLSVPTLAVHMPSTFRHLTLPAASYTPLVPGHAQLARVHMPNLPAHLVRARHVLNESGQPFAALSESLDLPAPVTVAGETLAECQLMTGIKGAMEGVAADVPEGSGTVFYADLVSSHWLYRDAIPPLGPAPWTYGTLAGAERASTLVVPLCPISVEARREILAALEDVGATLTPVTRTDRALIYRLQVPKNTPRSR